MKEDVDQSRPMESIPFQQAMGKKVNNSALSDSLRKRFCKYYMQGPECCSSKVILPKDKSFQEVKISESFFDKTT